MWKALNGMAQSKVLEPFEQVFAKEKYHCFASNQKGIMTGPVNELCFLNS